MKLTKKVFSSAIAMALVGAMTVVSAFATTTSTDAPCTTEQACATAIATVVAATGSSSASETVAVIPTTSSVAGVATTANGVYLATKVNGTAVTTSVANIAAAYGLTGSEKPYVKVSNLDAKKSPLAAAALENAAAAAGMTCGPMINVELGKMSAGKYSLLSADGADVTFKVGIPGNFADASKTFAVIAVRPGGAISVLQDVDSNPNTVTFAIKGGQAAYAIVKY